MPSCICVTSFCGIEKQPDLELKENEPVRRLIHLKATICNVPHLVWSGLTSLFCTILEHEDSGDACSKILNIARYLVRAPAMSKVRKRVSSDSKTREWNEAPVCKDLPVSLYLSSFLFTMTVHCNCCGEQAQVFCCYCSVFSKSAVESLKLAVEKDLVFNKRTQQQSGQRGYCLWDLEGENSFLFVIPCLWLLWSQWEELSVVKYPGMWYFCLMSQHRFHNVKEQKRAKVLSFFRNKSAKL